jgi:hypothetical protein
LSSDLSDNFDNSDFAMAGGVLDMKKSITLLLQQCYAFSI